MEGRSSESRPPSSHSPARISRSRALSLLWTISYPDTVQMVLTGVQILGSVWVVTGICPDTGPAAVAARRVLPRRVRPARRHLLNSFRTGNRARLFSDRYTAIGFNADDLGLTLVIGIPIAWHLMMTYAGSLRRTVRAAGLIYFAVAPFAILLTGTRGATIAGVVALSIVPLTLPRRSLRSFVLIAVMLVAIAATATIVVPQRMWARILSIKQEVLEGGSMTGRAGHLAGRFAT